MHRRPAGLVLVAVGIAVVTVSVAGFIAARGRPTPQAFGPASAAATTATSTAIHPEPHLTTSAAAIVVTTPDPVVQAPPTTLTLTSLHVSAAVIPIGVNGSDLQVPNNPAQVGWWVASAPAGSTTGSTVIDGHVDSAASGPGALYDVGLGRLASGDMIILTTAGGPSFSYRVYAQQVLPKNRGLPGAVFESGNQARLVLITCGGPFDRSRDSYLDNVVVYATLNSQ